VLYNVDIIDEVVAIVIGTTVLSVETYREEVYSEKNALEIDAFCVAVDSYRYFSNVENVPIVLPTMVDVYASNCINVSYTPAKIELVVRTFNSYCRPITVELRVLVVEALLLIALMVYVERPAKLYIMFVVEIA
jgi:hypothetical protein